jgi:hypothetical protein
MPSPLRGRYGFDIIEELLGSFAAAFNAEKTASPVIFMTKTDRCY